MAERQSKPVNTAAIHRGVSSPNLKVQHPKRGPTTMLRLMSAIHPNLAVAAGR